MDLNKATKENIAFMINEMKKKLTVANASILNPDNIDTDKYEDLLDLYSFVAGQKRFSISEMDAVVSELGQLRKK